MIDIGFLANLIGCARLDLSNEKAAQADLEGLLLRELPDVAIAREVRLAAGDIIDFMVDGLGVEMKVSLASKPGIARQLARYAEHQAVRGLILASNTAVILPPAILGKRVIFVSLGRAWL